MLASSNSYTNKLIKYSAEQINDDDNDLAAERVASRAESREDCATTAEIIVSSPSDGTSRKEIHNACLFLFFTQTNDCIMTV